MIPPLFQRGGSILPLQDGEAITLWVCPDRDCSFTLYEDDGESNDYLHGGYLTSTYSLHREMDLVVIQCQQEGRHTPGETIRFHIQCREKAPLGIHWDSAELPQILGEEVFDTAREGWHYYPSTKICAVKCGNGRTLRKLQISFGLFDLIRMDLE